MRSTTRRPPVWMGVLLGKGSQGCLELGEAVEGRGQQWVVAGVGRCRVGDQGYAVSVRQLRAFDALFGPVDGALVSALEA